MEHMRLLAVGLAGVVAVASSHAETGETDPEVFFNDFGQLALGWNSVPGGVYHVRVFDESIESKWDYFSLRGLPLTNRDGGRMGVLIGDPVPGSDLYRVEAFEPPQGSVFYESFEAGELLSTFSEAWESLEPGDPFEPTLWTIKRTDPGDEPSDVGPPGPHSGVYAAGTNYYGGYGLGGSVIYLSPIVDLTEVGPSRTVTLTFWHWHEIELGVEGYVALADPQKFPITPNLYSVSGVSSGWEQVAVNLPKSVNGSTVRLLFGFNYFGAIEQLAGWYIDDVCVMPSFLEIELAAYDGTAATFNVTGTVPGQSYRITSSETLGGPFSDTGVSFPAEAATGIVVPSPGGTFPHRFFRAEAQ